MFTKLFSVSLILALALISLGAKAQTTSLTNTNATATPATATGSTTTPVFPDAGKKAKADFVETEIPRYTSQPGQAKQIMTPLKKPKAWAVVDVM